MTEHEPLQVPGFHPTHARLSHRAVLRAMQCILMRLFSPQLQSGRADAFCHWVLGEHVDSGSHSSYMVLKSKCMSVCTPYQTNMRTCVHNSQGKEGLLTIQHSENGQHSLLIFKTPACSHILRPFRLAPDHGLQLSINGSGS